MIQLLSKYKSYLFTFLLTLGMIFTVNIFAATPDRTLGFQGQFYIDNTPGNAPVSTTFTFYDSPTGGNITGTPISKIIQVVNGYFGTTFTEADTSGVDLNQQLYLEISINGVTLSPRTTVNPTVSSLKSFGTFSYTSAPTVGPSGSLYFNTTSGELYVSNGTSWQLSGLASSTTQWVANGTSLNYMAGNVGIGTTTPNNLLQVVDLIDFNNTDFDSKVGYQAGKYNLTGLNYNTFLGYQSGMGSTTVTSDANNSTAVGYQALYSLTTGGSNTAIGKLAMYSNTTGILNSALGTNAMYSNTSGGFNVAQGSNTLYSNTTGAQNTALGQAAMYYNTTGSQNVAVGHQTMFSNLTGIFNTGLGRNALYFATSTTLTTAVGASAGQGTALYSNIGGTYIGHTAGARLQTGSDYNTLIGYQAGYNITTGSNNILIGAATSSAAIANLTTGSQNILIGNNISLPSATANGQLNIGNIIYGIGITEIGSTVSAGFIGIGTTTPGSLLHIKGSNPTFTIGDSRNQTWAVGDQFAAIDFASDDTSSGGTTGKVRARIAAVQLDTFGASQGLSFYTTRIANGLLSEQMRLTDQGDLILSRGVLTTPIGNTVGNGKNYLVITGAGASGSGNIQLTSSATSGADGLDLGTLEWHNQAAGTSTLNSRSAYINVGLSGTTGASIGSFMAFATDSNGVDGAGTERMRIDNQGNIGIGTTTPIARLSVKGVGTTTGFLAQFTDSANASKFTILDNGNVGIGTINPQYKLHVEGDVGAGGPISIKSNNTNTAGFSSVMSGNNSKAVYMDYYNSSYVGVVGSLFDADYAALFAGSQSSGLNIAATKSTASIKFFSGGYDVANERMRIEANGNVGIGTTTAKALLQVGASGDNVGISSSTRLYLAGGGIRVGSNIGSDYGYRMYRDSASGDLFFAGDQNNNTNYNFQNYSGGSLMRILTNGNVGIGTSTPGFRVHIDGTAAAESGSTTPNGLFGLSAFGGSGTAQIMTMGVLGGANSYSWIQARSRAGAVFNSLVLNPSGGNVGIGTTTPTQNLVVTGTIQSTGLYGGATTLSTDANGNIIRTPSDQKLKTNVETLTSALDKVNQMRGVSYNWIDTNRFGTSSEIGFIAQELETIVPEVVKSGGEYKSVNYQNLTALLTEAIKELSTKFNNLSEVVKTKFVDAEKVKTHEIQSDKLCLGSTCVTEDQLRQLLQQSNMHGSQPAVVESTTTVSEPTDEVPTPEQPVVELEPTPEPSPEPVTPPTE